MSSLDTDFIPLNDLLNSDSISRNKVKRALHAFECNADKDVENYLKSIALGHEKLGISRTYLIVDHAAYEANKEINIVAYVTITLCVTDFAEINEDDRKEILGSIPKDKDKTLFAGYLLAQLGRDSRYNHDAFDCSELVADAENIISQASDLVGGRVIYLDCKDELVNHYKNKLGYEFLYTAREKGLNKLYKVFRSNG